jgi:hypothetical protein
MTSGSLTWGAELGRGPREGYNTVPRGERRHDGLRGTPTIGEAPHV